MPALPCGTERNAAREYSTVESYVSKVKREVRLPEAVYNIEVEGNHNYIADGILVHNCDHLEAATRGEITRLIVNIPPGFMKSLLVSVFWHAWEWGPRNLPHLRYLATSYSEDFTKRDTRRTRDLIRSEWYQHLWGRRVQLTRIGERSFENTARGGRDTRPFRSLTGGRGDRLMIDDPHSTETAESDAERERTLRIFRESVPLRINDQKKSAIVIIMQRLHANDVTGEALRLDLGYTHLRLPMRFEADKPCKTYVQGKLFFQDPRKTEGELLAPQRINADQLAVIERGMGSYAIAAQNQQRPGPREGAMFKRHWFEIVGAAPAEGRVVRAWDLAATKKDARKSPDPDWTVGIRMRKTAAGIFYIESEVRLREESFAVEKAIKQAAEIDGQHVRIRLPQDPGAAGKTTAAAYIKALVGKDVRIRPETGDKATRAVPLQVQAEAGNVKIVAGPWIEAYLDELVSFPGGNHDDRVDATSAAFDELLRFDQESGHVAPRQVR